MTTYYKNYGVTASITEHKDGTATLTTSVNGGKRKIKKYASKKSALAAWRRLCA